MIVNKHISDKLFLLKMRPFRLASFCIGFHRVKTLLARHCRHKSSSSPDQRFLERFVQINSCGSLYQKWREEGVYRKVPDGDLAFRVPFIDTRPGESSDASPTVLALHGAPGSWRDYLPLATFLHDRGCRVIAPSFPDFHVYKPGIFRHSDVERASYVRDFLGAISVNHIKLLICHSSAVYPSLQMCLNNTPVIKSLTLLNPGTFDLEGMSSTKHHKLMRLFMKISEIPLGLNFLDIFGSFMLKNILRVRVRFESILDPLLSATVMMRSNIPESKEKFIAVSQKMPILYVFSEDDPVISKNPSYKVAEALGAKTSDIFIYDKDLCLVQEGTITPKLKVIAMKEGSHYVFLKHQALINNEILDFIKRQRIL